VSAREAVCAALDAGRLRHDVTCRLVTSGYDDRYLGLSGRYSLDIANAGCMRWDSREDAVGVLILLTERTYEDVSRLVATVTPVYTSRWECGPVSKAGPINPRALEAIGALSTDAVRTPGCLSEVGLARYRAALTAATQDDRDCARYWMAECDRLNARTGRAQVPVAAEVSS